MVPYGVLHFIGILTPEMASLAYATIQLGKTVTGSDDHSDTVFTPVLTAAGATLYDMFAQTNIGKSVEAVVVSRYYSDRHPEVSVARQRDVPVITETEYTKMLTESSRKLAVLDSYTSPIIASWMTHVWRQAHVPVAGLTHAVTLPDHTLAHIGEHEWFVVPFSGFKRNADTYEADFMTCEPEIVILPTITYDYPELYMTLDDVYTAYYRFARRVPRKGLIIGNSDYQRVKRLRMHLADRHIETYGFERDANWHIREINVEGETTSFHLAHDRNLYGPFTIPYVGTTYVYAAAAVCVTSLLMEMKPDVIARGLASAPHLARYLTKSTDREGRLIIDDAADHPDTIEAVLTNIKEQYPDKRIWCIYQPGSYLRTKALGEDLDRALALADFVYLADIKGYPREKSEGLHTRHLVARMKQRHPQTYYFESSSEMSALLADRVPSTDCIVTLGPLGICQEVVAPLLPQETTE